MLPEKDEYGIVKISAVTWGVYNEEQSKTLPDNSLFLESRRIYVGDFLISRANTLELLGNPVIVHKTTKNLMLSDKVLRLVAKQQDKKWLSIFLRSFNGRKEIESRSTGNQLSHEKYRTKGVIKYSYSPPPPSKNKPKSSPASKPSLPLPTKSKPASKRPRPRSICSPRPF